MKTRVLNIEIIPQEGIGEAVTLDMYLDFRHSRAFDNNYLCEYIRIKHRCIH